MRIVAKFGGSSVANLSCIENCAKTIAQIPEQVIVVVSAMAGQTDQLLEWASFFGSENAALKDMLLASGEQVTASLLAMALEKLGIRSESLLGWQVPILTDDRFADANILEVQASYIEELLQKGITPVVAGFQGVTHRYQITTLGRGGSDVTAVALAKALNAHECRIYKDVDAVYSADPVLIPSAKRVQLLTYDEMAILARHGCKVLQGKAIDYARIHNVPVRILSTFVEDQGTYIVKEIQEAYRLISITQKDKTITCVGHNLHLSPYVNELGGQVGPHYICFEGTLKETHEKLFPA